MKDYEDEAFDELAKAQQRKVATGVTDGSLPVQEPVAWLGRNQIVYFEFEEWMNDCTVPLYTSSCAAQPAEQDRKPLTEQEFEKLYYKKYGHVRTGLMGVVKLVEAAHGIHPIGFTSETDFKE